MIGYAILACAFIIGFLMFAVASRFETKSVVGAIESSGIAFIIIPVVIFCIMLICFPFSWYYHTGDLGIVRSRSYAIAVQEERCTRLREFLNNIPAIKNGAVVLNSDTPYKALIEQLASAESDLAQSKKTVADARVSIAQRQVGPYGFIVSVMGRE